MKKNIKYLVISIFVSAISMMNTIGAAACVYFDNKLSRSMVTEEEGAPAPEKGEDKEKAGNAENKDKMNNENKMNNEDKINKTGEIDEKDVAKPVSALQLSVNTVEITFNIPVEKKDATNPKNYWVESTEAEKPTGIATLGKNEKLTNKNSLTNDMVKIEPSTESGRVYRMTFNNKITSGAEHKIHIYFIAPKGAEVYKGENGAIIFRAK